MRQFIPGEDVEKFLVELSRELAGQIQTVVSYAPPKLTTTERDAIPNPSEGMVIYNTTTHVLNHHNGTAWGAV